MSEDFQKLSQQEIDALLEMLPHDSEELAAPVPVTRRRYEREVQLYDFRSPVKFSKEQVWILQMIHENLAKRLTAALSVYLRSKVQVSLSILDQGTYAVFIADLANPTVTHIVSLDPLPGRIILALELELVTAILDRMLGGTGVVQTRAREVTSMGLVLVRKAVEKIQRELAGAWENVIEFKPVIEDVVLNPLYAGVAFPADSALLAVYDVFFQESSGTVSIIIPFSVLDPIAQDLTAGMWGRRNIRGTKEGNRLLLQQVAAHLSHICLPISVRLTSSQLSLGEIIDLRKGDIILLNMRREGLAKVFVGSEHKWWGRPGIVDGRMAIQIQQVEDSEEPQLPISAALAGISEAGGRPDDFTVLKRPRAYDQPSATEDGNNGSSSSGDHFLDTVNIESPGDTDD